MQVFLEYWRQINDFLTYFKREKSTSPSKSSEKLIFLQSKRKTIIAAINNSWKLTWKRNLLFVHKIFNQNFDLKQSIKTVEMHGKEKR